jgi:hypothetical protein
MFSRYVGAGVDYVCKNHARAAECIVLKQNVVVYGNVILDSDVVADDNPVAHIDILAKGAIPAYPCPAADVHPMPDARTGANEGALVDDCAWMCGEFRHQ